MPSELQVLFLPFLACLILTGIHVYLGIHVISRKVIFVDIALAQIAALGATAAFLVGYDPASEGAYFVSLGFAVMAAVIFALTRTRNERVPQEAVIGLTYATAAAAAILLADISPHGAEHLHDLLAGSIVWVTPEKVATTTILYAIIGLFHFVFRRRFLLISLEPERAYAEGINVRLWDFLFYLSFGVVITSSVQIAGVLLVFCYLVAPSVFAVMFFDDLRKRLLTGWAMATLVSAVGLLFSYDRPSGPTIMVCFAAALILGGLLKAAAGMTARRRALAVVVAAAALGLAVGAASILRSGAPSHADEAHEAPVPAGQPPDTVAGFVEALGDPDAARREAAAEALAEAGDPTALPALHRALARPGEDEWVRLRLAQAVSRMGDPAGLPVLLAIAREGDAGLARIEALGSLCAAAGFEPVTDSDPGSPGWQARLQQLESWWRDVGPAPRWDEATRTFR